MIVVDLDEILAEYLESFILFHNASYGTALKKEDFTSYLLSKTIEIEQADARRRHYEFFQTYFAEKIRPVQGSQEGVDALLASGEELAVVTSRHDELSEKTNQWIGQYFPKKFVSVHLTNGHSVHGTAERSKAALCKQLGARFVIEDQIRYAFECKDSDRKVLLLDKPWNQKSVPGDIMRVASWQEAVEYIRHYYLI